MNFEEKMMKKYPTLFYEKDGQLYCPCGVACPVGWEDIVDSLFGAMVDYSNGYRYVNNPNKFIRLKSWFGRKIQKILSKLAKMADPLDYGKKGFLTQQEVKSQKEAHPTRVKWQKRFYSWRGFFDVEDDFLKQMNLCPKIEQVKQKISLRVYVSNASPEVYGMISLAEYICSKTCEVSGKNGALCLKNGWYSTLSVDKAEQLGYKPIQQNV